MSNFKSVVLNKETVKELMGIDIYSLDELIDKDLLLDFGMKEAIIYNYDSLKVGEINELELNSENIMEARFFNEERELVLISEEEFKGYVIIEDSKDLIVNETMEIYSEKYSKLEVKKYLELDEDGQGFVKYLKPCKLTR